MELLVVTRVTVETTRPDPTPGGVSEDPRTGTRVGERFVSTCLSLTLSFSLSHGTRSTPARGTHGSRGRSTHERDSPGGGRPSIDYESKGLGSPLRRWEDGSSTSDVRPHRNSGGVQGCHRLGVSSGKGVSRRVDVVVPYSVTCVSALDTKSATVPPRIDDSARRKGWQKGIEEDRYFRGQ